MRASIVATWATLACTPTDPNSSSDPDEPYTAGFRVVALHEGRLDVLVSDHRGFIMLDGEPIPLTADATPKRLANMHVGLEPRHDRRVRTLALAGGPRAGAWLTTVHEGGRVAGEYEVYVRGEDRWDRRTSEHDLLIEYYPAIVARGEALLGLRKLAVNHRRSMAPTDNSPEAQAYRRELEAAFAAAPAEGFVHLAGPAPAAMPELPRELEPRELYDGFGSLALHAAVAQVDGTLHALATPEDLQLTLLLTWPPDQARAQVQILPLSRRLDETVSLSLSDDTVLIGGATEQAPYLAEVRGTSVVPIAVDLPFAAAIRSAARSPEGALWIVVPEERGAWQGALWTKPVGGDWRFVSLPRPRAELFPSTKQREWFQPWEPPDALEVVWAQGAAWVVADLGPLEGDPLHEAHVLRTAVYTTVPTWPPIGQEPTLLAPRGDDR